MPAKAISASRSVIVGARRMIVFGVMESSYGIRMWWMDAAHHIPLFPEALKWSRSSSRIQSPRSRLYVQLTISAYLEGITNQDVGGDQTNKERTRLIGSNPRGFPCPCAEGEQVIEQSICSF